jgi:hypothetical protein
MSHCYSDGLWPKLIGHFPRLDSLSTNSGRFRPKKLAFDVIWARFWLISPDLRNLKNEKVQILFLQVTPMIDSSKSRIWDTESMCQFKNRKKN